MLGIIRNGRLTRDPEQRDVGGQTVTKITVAENCSRRDPSTNEPYKLFINCSIWGKTGDTVAKHFAKGDPISLTGEYYDREYVDKTSGEKRVSHEMHVLDVTFLPRPKKDEGGESQRPAAKAKPAQTVSDEDELPF